MTYTQLIEKIEKDLTGMAKGYTVSFLQKEFCNKCNSEERMEKMFEADKALFKQIETSLLANKTPNEGDFVEYEEGKFVRISRLHRDSKSFQLSNKIGVYVSEGFTQASGCVWDTELDTNERSERLVENLIQTTDTKKGRCWTFSEGSAGADRGVYFDIDFKVWKLKKLNGSNNEEHDYAFVEKYTCNTSIISAVFDNNSQAGMLETYGDDVKQVIEINKKSPKTLWTVIDGNDGNLYVSAGFHIVNRIHYVITNEEWEDETEEYPY